MRCCQKRQNISNTGMAKYRSKREAAAKAETLNRQKNNPKALKRIHFVACNVSVERWVHFAIYSALGYLQMQHPPAVFAPFVLA